MSTQTETPSGPPPGLGLLHWLKKNLFSSWFNALLTLVSLAVIFFALRGILHWVFVTANWDPVTHSLKQFAVGLYPAEQVWRIGIILA
ncbi:MAG: amino acid ABC transporter permease, partial [Anaerolineae bacterium]